MFVLFVLFDTGETEFLVPVMNLLDKSSYKIIAFGTSEHLTEHLEVIKSSSLGLSSTVDRTWPRTKFLPEEDIEILKPYLEESSLIVTGNASNIQGQVVSLYPEKSVMVWDNFKGDDSGAYWETAQSIIGKAGLSLFPSATTVEELPEKPSHFEIVGHPSVDKWVERIHSVSSSKVKRRIRLDESKRTILYIAGWSGDPQCAEGTKMFAQIAQDLSEFNIIMQLHPKSDGNFEKELMGDSALFCPRCTTEELSNIADIVVCHKSTAAQKIAAAGKKVLFVVPEQDYTNTLIDSGYFPIVRHLEEFPDAIEQVDCQDTPDVYRIMGLMRDSATRVANIIKQKIKI